MRVASIAARVIGLEAAIWNWGLVVDGRIVGTITATVALIILGVVALGLYTSLAGTAAGALADPARSGRNAAVVAGFVAILILAYMLVGQTVGRYPLSGSRGGPSVTPPP